MSDDKCHYIPTPEVCGTCGQPFPEGHTYHVRSRLVGSEFRTIAWHGNCAEPVAGAAGGATNG